MTPKEAVAPQTELPASREKEDGLNETPPTSSENYPTGQAQVICVLCNRLTAPEDMLGEECTDCVNMIQQTQELRSMRQVTREMAQDAGDPALEGQWIEW